MHILQMVFNLSWYSVFSSEAMAFSFYSLDNEKDDLKTSKIQNGIAISIAENKIRLSLV